MNDREWDINFTLSLYHLRNFIERYGIEKPEVNLKFPNIRAMYEFEAALRMHVKEIAMQFPVVIDNLDGFKMNGLKITMEYAK